MIFLFFILSFVFSSLSLCLLFHLIFHLLFSSLLFSSPFFFSLSLSLFLFLSSFSNNGTHSEKEFQHLSGTWPYGNEWWDEVNQHLSETFHLVLSCLIVSFVFSSLCRLSLSSFSVSVPVCWWCVCVCRCVWLCVFVWSCVVCCYCVCGAWCGTLKTLCVDSKRLHVYIRNVSVYAGNTRTCFPTCVRGAGIHWDVLNLHTEAFLNLHTGGLRQFSLPKNHARRVLTWPQRGSP